MPFIGNEADKTSLDTYQYPFGYIFGTSSYNGGTAVTQYYYGSSTNSITASTYYIPSLLKSVTVTGGNILYGAFYDCKGLTSINIFNGVTSIGDYAFYNCSGLTSITIPDSVTKIGERAFYNCSGLTSINIGNGVKNIGDYAFYGCNGLTSITIPDSVISMGKNIFSGCSSLGSITIPFVGSEADKTSSDTYQYPFGYIFGTSSYNGGTAVTQYYYRSNTISTSSRTYYIPSSLKSVTVTGGNILYGAFYDCSGLTSINLGNGVKSISGHAFYGCSGLISITIPDSVMSIGEGAFYNCSGLTDIVISEGNTVYHSNGNCLIETDSKVLIGGCRTSVIPDDDSVTTISNFAFAWCSGMTNIAIPDNLTSIGEKAFYFCSGLTSIDYNGTKEQWNAINKGSYWDRNTGDYIVHCTDGDIAK